MSTLTYTLVILPTYPGAGFSKTQARYNGDVPRPFTFGLSSSQRTLNPSSFVKTQARYNGDVPRPFTFGLSSSQRTPNPSSFVKTQARYNGDVPRPFTFFYPSNGKVPGSPIPGSGQLSPRPV